MLKRPTFYTGQHISIEDLDQLVMNNIDIIKDLLSDWVPNTAKGILTESMPASTGIELLVEGVGSELLLKVNKGTGYLSYDKLKLDSDVIFNLAVEKDLYGNSITMPTGTGGGAITRFDIIGIHYKENLISPKTIDFIDLNKNIFSREVATEIEFGGELVYVQGNRSNVLQPVDPDLPDTVFPLARIHLRDNTAEIVSSGQGNTAQGYVEDLSRQFLFNK